MLAALILGLTGSLGHCAGMCSGVALMLGQKGQASGWQILLLHLGRVTTYGLLGGVAGTLGYTVSGLMAGGMHHENASAAALWPGLSRWQGGLALATAVLAGYMALALLGRAPSPERYLVWFTRRWGQMMRRRQKPGFSAGRGDNIWRNLASPFSFGLLWGFLPCGLVLTALLTAAVSGSPVYGALTMIVFGLGTWPVMLGVNLLSGRADWRRLTRAPGLRHAAALVVLLFGVQMALRGLAAWGVVQHLHLGDVMLW